MILILLIVITIIQICNCIDVINVFNDIGYYNNNLVMYKTTNLRLRLTSHLLIIILIPKMLVM